MCYPLGSKRKHALRISTGASGLCIHFRCRYQRSAALGATVGKFYAYSCQPLEVRNGIIYALATSFVRQSPINIVAAYDANSGKKLWSIQVPNAHVQPPASDIIVGMSICNTMMYLWTMHDLSAYNVKIYAYNAKNGSLG